MKNGKASSWWEVSGGALQGSLFGPVYLTSSLTVWKGEWNSMLIKVTHNNKSGIAPNASTNTSQKLRALPGFLERWNVATQRPSWDALIALHLLKRAVQNTQSGNRSLLARQGFRAGLPSVCKLRKLETSMDRHDLPFPPAPAAWEIKPVQLTQLMENQCLGGVVTSPSSCFYFIFCMAAKYKVIEEREGQEELVARLRPFVSVKLDQV